MRTVLKGVKCLPFTDDPESGLVTGGFELFSSSVTLGRRVVTLQEYCIYLSVTITLG